MDPGAIAGLRKSSVLWGFPGETAGLQIAHGDFLNGPGSEDTQTFHCILLFSHPALSLLIPATVSTVFYNPPFLPPSSKTCCPHPQSLPGAATCGAHSFPLRVAHLTRRVADTPLHHCHSPDCSRGRRSKTHFKEKQHTTCLSGFHRRTPFTHSFPAQDLLNRLETEY